MRRLFLVISLLLLLPNFISGQEVQTLPKDPRIKTSKMANGFTYYLVKSDKMKGFADFYLVQKVGSSLEEESQKGLTAMIGNMGVRGTRNFPGYTIMTYIDELGMTAGRDFRIINGPSNSVYKMANVPVGRSPLVIDSTLLILFNWACSINIDEEDVQDEKLYYKNMFVKNMNVDERAAASHMRTLFPGSGFDMPDFDSMLSKFDKYSSKDIRQYYYKWYRPELQALVVVGDIDSLSLDKQIKTLFQATPRYLDKVENRVPYVSPSDGLRISVAVDKEAPYSNVDIYFKTTPIPFQLRKSAVPYVMNYMNDMMAFLIKDRLSEMIFFSGIPVMDITAEYGSYMKIGEMESLHINAKTSPEYARQVLGMITRELYSIKRNGFSREEFLSARDRYYNHLNYTYDWRIYTTNDFYARRCIENYLGGYSLASIEMNKEYMDVVWYEVGLSQFNTFVSSYLRNGDNTTITCSVPASFPADSLSGDIMEKTFLSAMKEPAVPYQSSPIISELSIEEVKPGTVVSESREPITNSIMWTLSNGATVLFKNTQSEPNKVTFNAIGKGGLSLYNGNVPLFLKFINDVAALESLGSYKSLDIQRFLNLKGMSLQKEMDLSTNRLYGSFSSSDMKEFLELVYLNFNNHQADNSAFERYKNRVKEEDRYADKSPEYLFADSLSALLYNRSRFSPSSYAFGIDNVNYASMTSFIKESYSNAANFTFMFVGDANADNLKELVCKYIASLPGNPNRKDTWRVVPFYLQKRDVSSHISMEMELPRRMYNMTIAGPAPYNAEGMALYTVISSVIEKRIKWSLLEKGVPSEVEVKFRQYPEEFLTISTSFVTQNYSENCMDYLYDVLRDLEKNGVKPEEIAMVKSVLKSRSSFREITDNSFWVDVLTGRFIYGKDFYSKRNAILDGLSFEKVNAALSNYLKNCSHTVLTMAPSGNK